MSAFTNGSTSKHTLHNSFLDLIGSTPLVRLDKIAAAHGLKCTLYGKAEGFSAGGSVKDRIALRMVEQAEKEGRITPGQTTLVEPTSGNTGIGLALVCAIKGYKLIITMPEKMSREKELTLLALGAEIIRTPTEAAHDSPLSNIGRAKSLIKELPNAVMLNQYGNPGNPDAHEEGTAQEILEALHGQQIDAVVAGAGTGGTVTGLSRGIKPSHPSCKVVAVDPVGSILARPESFNTLQEGESDQYKVEGIGYDFIPDVLDHKVVDYWVKTRDEESFAATRELIRTEGALVGGSSGAAVAGALKWLKDSPEGKLVDQEGKNVVVILPDSLRNYVTAPWLIAPSRRPSPQQDTPLTASP